MSTLLQYPFEKQLLKYSVFILKIKAIVRYHYVTITGTI